MTMAQGNSRAFLKGEGTAKGGILRSQSRRWVEQPGHASGSSHRLNTFFPQCSKQRIWPLLLLLLAVLLSSPGERVKWCSALFHSLVATLVLTGNEAHQMKLKI
jgi:hypothetical protein